MGKINETLKQAAIKEGQWGEQREVSGVLTDAAAKMAASRERRRLSELKRAALAEGLPWAPPH